MSDAESELAFDAPDWDETDSEKSSELAFDAPVWDDDSDEDEGGDASETTASAKGKTGAVSEPKAKLKKRSFEEEFRLMRDVDYRNSTVGGYARSCDELFEKLCDDSEDQDVSLSLYPRNATGSTSGESQSASTSSGPKGLRWLKRLDYQTDILDKGLTLTDLTEPVLIRGV